MVMLVYQEKNKHCAFTDLIYYKGLYYLAFRIGEKHMFSKSKIVVMKSKYCKKWEMIDETKSINDVRDPRFIIEHKELFLLFNYQKTFLFNKNKVKEQYLMGQKVGYLKDSYKIKRNAFVCSANENIPCCYDAEKGGKVFVIEKNKRKYLPCYPDSTEFSFFKKDNMEYFLVRCDRSPTYWYIKEKNQSHIIRTKNNWHCPLFFKKDDKQYLITRETSKDYRKSRCYIFEVTVNPLDLKHIKKLIAFGDCGYFGYASGSRTSGLRSNGLISYHSSYDEHDLTKTAIYIEEFNGN